MRRRRNNIVRHEGNLPPNEHLMLESLRDGDVLQITTGAGEDAWHYSFTVTEASRWPKGTLTATSPAGTQEEVTDFELHGAGTWTNRSQNPVQTQEHAFSSYFQSVYYGGNLVGRFAGDDDRVVFDKPGQEVTEIVLTPADSPS